ncbi:BlaI/MecI/CopY family transcriptional regulator [bacterium]|nr:BlaI/MecI/CopY family transcriptional regulator [bacterium]
MTELEIGSGQMKVLRALWKEKRATAQKLTEILNETEPIKFSTVSTFLRILVKKGVVAFDVDKRTYIFYPLVKEKDIANHAVMNLIDHVFAGSKEGFVSFIINNNYIEPDELKKIKAMIDNKE